VPKQRFLLSTRERFDRGFDFGERTHRRQASTPALSANRENELRTQGEPYQPHGIAAIIGTLNIARPTGFIPNVSDAFAILTYGSHSGAFPSAPLRAPAAP
jgi:hypothetical protein